MKKLKLFLAAAMLIGIGSAFTTLPKQNLVAAFGQDASGWHQVDTGRVGIDFICDEGNTFCLYESDLVTPLSNQEPNKQFVYLIGQ